jgi:ParB/RepB/Spo0J family partition protein
MLDGSFRRIPISEITILRDERQRRIIETDDLQKSIKQIGLINPIVVKLDENGRHVLVAGERRLTACRALKWEEIPVQFSSDLSPLQAAIIELEENIKRRDLPWMDLVLAVGKLHALHREDDEKWSQAKTAGVLSLTEGTVSMYLKVHGSINDERIKKCTTVRQAYDVIDRRESRKQEAAFAQLLEGDWDEDDPDSYPDIFEDEDEEGLPPLKPMTREQVLTAQEQDMASMGMIKINGIWTADPNRPIEPGTAKPTPIPIVIEGKPNRKLSTGDLVKDILHGSFLEWAPAYSGSRFNFIHCDFPYGAAEVGPQMLGNEHTIYEDSPEIYMKLLDCFADNLDRFFSVSGWIMFWYSERLGKETRDLFKYKCPSLEIQTHPLIWLHSDNSGISSAYKWRPRHIYDTALLMRRGDMPLVRLKSDAHASPSSREVHPSTKPEAMLRYFFEMFVDDQTSLLDPTCGGGSALRAAESLGAKRVQGIEMNWEYAEAARLALKNSRSKMAIIQGL